MTHITHITPRHTARRTHATYHAIYMYTRTLAGRCARARSLTRAQGATQNTLLAHFQNWKGFIQSMDRETKSDIDDPIAAIPWATAADIPADLRGSLTYKYETEP